MNEQPLGERSSEDMFSALCKVFCRARTCKFNLGLRCDLKHIGLDPDAKCICYERKTYVPATAEPLKETT
ncbi:MAG: hypothetical protein WC565_07580 [Parcubacteria group bacterium]